MLGASRVGELGAVDQLTGPVEVSRGERIEGLSGEDIRGGGAFAAQAGDVLVGQRGAAQ